MSYYGLPFLKNANCHMDKDQFLLLATRVLSGNAEGDDASTLEDVLLHFPEFQPLYDQYARYWEANTTVSAAQVETALASTWEKINKGNAAPIVPVRRFRPMRWAVAAAMAGLLLLAGWYFQRQKPIEAAWLLSQNPKGVRSSIILPDGSKVWLAGDSKLQYPAVFASDKRELKLQGEAFFEVVKNAKKPFIIHLKDGDVRVLGTSFNINSYDDEEYISTSVATGRVAYIPARSGYRDSIFLTPGMKVQQERSSGKSELLETDAALDRSWIDGTLVFQAADLGSIGRRLERFYGKPVVFTQARYRNFRYTGTFSNSTADEIILYLSRTRSFPFTVTDTAITIGK